MRANPRRRTRDDREPRTSFYLGRLLAGSTDKRSRRALAELRNDPELRRVVNQRVLELAEDDGVDPDADRPFIALLKKYLPQIIALILDELLGALGGAV